MILHTRVLDNIQSKGCPLLMLHGLFGSLDNLAALANAFKNDRSIILADVRNHGKSPHHPAITYQLMAQDMVDTLDSLKIDRVSVIGHSMGGKIAMAMTALVPERIEQIIVIDMAPVAYTEQRHNIIFAAIDAVEQAGVKSRVEAATILQQAIDDLSIISFILKSFHQGKWAFNWRALWQNYSIINGWQSVPTWPHASLFIRGENSDYLLECYRQTLLIQFPQARAHLIANAGHWVHAEKPVAVIRAIRRFLYSNQSS